MNPAIDLIWCGEEKYEQLRHFDGSKYVLESKPFFKEQFHRIRYASEENYIEFFVRIFDHENEEYEYEYIDFDIVEIEKPKINKISIPSFHFSAKYMSYDANDDVDLVGTYKYTENINNRIPYLSFVSTKLVCRSIHIPSLKSIIKIGSYPNSLEVENFIAETMSVEGGLVII